MSALGLLQELRAFAGEKKTIGLDDDVLASFIDTDSTLTTAIERAYAAHQTLREEYGDLLSGPEIHAIKTLQHDLVNFYPDDCVNPYVAIAANGPWIVTSHGAVLHDSGGYGMLGFGHAPAAAIDTMSQPWVMANVMSPSFSHIRLTERLKKEVGHRRGHCPFHQFICMNSGSESVTVAARFSDINAMHLTSPGQKHEGKEVKFLALQGAFHGRTDRPAQLSDSSLGKYKKHLYSFNTRSNLVTIPPNDVAALNAAFEAAEQDGVFFEAMFLEPVMGEGNPGMATTPEFYAEARRLTAETGTLLLIDSIQAGLRAHGMLSIVDYPGFETLDAPDMETYSKALNAGQYPLSVLALNEKTAKMYAKGVYGNTMTCNPRALEVACTVLDQLTPDVRANISDRGQEMVDALKALQEELPGTITFVQGTGLLLSAELDSTKYKVVGFGGVEEYCRIHGIGVIHGGTNSLRFTPHFELTSKEIDLVISVVRKALIALKP